MATPGQVDPFYFSRISMSMTIFSWQLSEFSNMFNIRRKALYSLLNTYDFGPFNGLEYKDGVEKERALRRSRLPKWQSWLLTTAGLILLLLAFFRLGQLSPPSSAFDLLKQPRLDESDLGLRPNTLYPKPLGKKMLMLDIDTRPWNIEPSLTKQSQLAWGRLNHYLYGISSTVSL